MGRRLVYEYHSNIFHLLENDHIKAITTLHIPSVYLCVHSDD